MANRSTAGTFSIRHTPSTEPRHSRTTSEATTRAAPTGSSATAQYGFSTKRWHYQHLPRSAPAPAARLSATTTSNHLSTIPPNDETIMRYSFILFACLLSSTAWGQTNVDFQDLSLPGPNTAYYGQDYAGGFTSRGTFLNNQYTDFGGGFFVWDGFAYSNVVNTTTAGHGNQFAAYHLPGGDG